MQRWSLVFACVLMLSLSAWTDVAHAGPVEQLVQVAMHPTNPKVIVIRYEYGGEGIFVTEDGGQDWSYVCNSYIDPSTNARRGTLAVANDGTMMLGVFDGIWTGDHKGCGWSLEPSLMKKWVPDIQQDPSDPDVIYAITSNGDAGALNGIVKRDKSGAWTDFGSKEEMLITRIRPVKLEAGGLRFYESAVKGMLPGTVVVNGMPMAQDVPNYIIRVSDDDGASWEEFPFAAPEMGSFRLVAVDPSNPDRVVAWIDRDVTSHTDDSVMVSSDKGKTFTEYKTVTDLGGVEITPEGHVFIADRGATTDPSALRGLWQAANLDTEPTQLISDLALSCLEYRPDNETLYACQLRKFGTIDQTSGAYTDLFVFDKVEHFADCGTDMSAVCEGQLCKDYCVLGHFPETPMCVAYQSPNCGPCSAIPTAAGCTLPDTNLPGSGSAGSSGSTGGAAGAAMMPMAGGGGAGAGATAGTVAPPAAGNGGSGGSTGTKDDGGGGCSASATGADTSASFAAWLLAALALVLDRRRRARATHSRK
jgi:MYXO-CTERM domain-containing protein